MQRSQLQPVQMGLQLFKDRQTLCIGFRLITGQSPTDGLRTATQLKINGYRGLDSAEAFMPEIALRQ